MQTGAAFGGMVGMHLIQVLPSWWNIQPGVYALVASSAMLGGVFRSAISLVGISTQARIPSHAIEKPDKSQLSADALVTPKHAVWET